MSSVGTIDSCTTDGCWLCFLSPHSSNSTNWVHLHAALRNRQDDLIAVYKCIYQHSNLLRGAFCPLWFVLSKLKHSLLFKGSVQLVLCLCFLVSLQTAVTEKQVDILCSCLVRHCQGFRSLIPSEMFAVMLLRASPERSLQQMILCLTSVSRKRSNVPSGKKRNTQLKAKNF